MEQRLSMITLGVGDLECAVAFYEEVVGWTATSVPLKLPFSISAGWCSPSMPTTTWRRT